MSYRIEVDGTVTFTCNACQRETQVNNSKQLPVGWCVVGVLEMAQDPEVGEPTDRPEASSEDLHEVGALVGAHYHNERCGLKALKHPKVARLVERLKIALALYWGCILVVDGTGGDVGVGRSEAHDVAHEDDDGDGKPKGKHRRYRLGEGGGPAI